MPFRLEGKKFIFYKEEPTPNQNSESSVAVLEPEQTLEEKEPELEIGACSSWPNYKEAPELEQKLLEIIPKVTFEEFSKAWDDANKEVPYEQLVLRTSPTIEVTESVEEKYSDQYFEELLKQEEVPDEKTEWEEFSEVLNEQFVDLTGAAGTGKTYSVRRKLLEDDSFCELAATTGIAAINLGADSRTINSLLKYFDTNSLKRAYKIGSLHHQLRILRAKGKKKLGIEEKSMLAADQLDIIFAAVQDINNDKTGRYNPLGILLIGDYLQLPPIKAEFAFRAKCYKEFERNQIKLTKVHRQENQEFINAINFIREGDGRKAVPILKDCGVTFIPELIEEYDGTTLITKNDQVDYYNADRLNKLPGTRLKVSPTKRGTQLKEWDRLIPNQFWFKIGAYVMILCNDVENWEYVNGDGGYIVDFHSYRDNNNILQEVFKIRIKRTNRIVSIKKIRRLNLMSDTPPKSYFSSMFQPSVDFKSGEWIIGTIDYHPLRLAYASTVHKAQGLSLDKVQIDARDSFFGFPSMCYVAVSRARTPEGLIIVGNEKQLVSQINVNPEVRRFI